MVGMSLVVCVHLVHILCLQTSMALLSRTPTGTIAQIAVRVWLSLDQLGLQLLPWYVYKPIRSKNLQLTRPRSSINVQAVAQTIWIYSQMHSLRSPTQPLESSTLPGCTLTVPLPPLSKCTTKKASRLTGLACKSSMQIRRLRA